jgi:CspA family cold shock protein
MFNKCIFSGFKKILNKGKYKMSEVKQGTVKWFNDKKGFGFIESSEGGKDLFVHMNEIKMDGFKTLKDGQSVDYEVGTSDKGPCATNVVPK